MRSPKRSLFRFVVLLVALAAAPRLVEASCPDGGSPSLSVCQPYTAVFLPTIAGLVFVRGDSVWFGGGPELLAFTWSDNSPRFGPGQGKIRFDVYALKSSDDQAGVMVMYRGNVTVSFERNASRSWLIPYFSGSLGGMHERRLGDHAFVDVSLGLFALYLRSFIVDIEVGWLLPFAEPERFGGLRVALSLSAALW